MQKNVFTKQKETHRLREQAYGCQKKDGGGAWVSQGVWDGHVHTAVFKMDNQQGPTGHHMEFCSMLHGSLGERGVWGENGFMYMYG